MRKNNHGFFLFSLLILLPFIFALSLFWGWLGYFLTLKNQVSNICYHHVLKAQEKLVAENHKLLALNPKAWTLIQAKRTIDVLLASSPPQAIPALLRKKQSIIAQQKRLKSVQLQILKTAQRSSYQVQIQFQKEWLKLQRHLKNTWNTFWPYTTIRFNWSKSKVQPQLSEIAPPYKRSYSHERIQLIQAQWHLPLQSIFPPWLKRFISLRKFWRGSCASHPHQKGEQWIAKIGVANHL